jgi:hypothetical protein
MDLEFSWLYLPAIAFVIVIVAASLMVGIVRRKSVGVPLANTKRLRDNPAFSRKLRTRIIALGVLALLLLVTMSSAVLASSRPVTKTIDNPVKYNRDIVLCLDVSGSMVNTDTQLIQKFKDLLKGFKGERVSMVVFNSVSSQVFPLTDDYGYINNQLDYVFNGFYEHPNGPAYDLVKYTLDLKKGGSLIGDGLTACTTSFDNKDSKRSRSVILATDNVPNGDSIVSLSDAEGLAENRGIKVYAINPGSYDFETRKPLPKQEEELRNVAKDTGGQYYEFNDTHTVSGIVNAISKDQAAQEKAAPIVTKQDDPAILIWILVIFALPTLYLYRRLNR